MYYSTERFVFSFCIDLYTTLLATEKLLKRTVHLKWVYLCPFSLNTYIEWQNSQCVLSKSQLNSDDPNNAKRFRLVGPSWYQKQHCQNWAVGSECERRGKVLLKSSVYYKTVDVLDQWAEVGCAGWKLRHRSSWRLDTTPYATHVNLRFIPYSKCNPFSCSHIVSGCSFVKRLDDQWACDRPFKKKRQGLSTLHHRNTTTQEH